MTKRREEQSKRQKSREEQTDMHDKKRLKKAVAHYQGSIQQTVDSANEHVRAVDGDDAAPAPVGPNYRRKRRQKTYLPKT